jgi:hypothetical protein
LRFAAQYPFFALLESGGKMSRLYLYSDRTGREVFRAIDPDERLPVPEVGETIKLESHRYTIEYVRLIESISPATLPKEYRVRVHPIEERAQAATPFKR